MIGTRVELRILGKWEPGTITTRPEYRIWETGDSETGQRIKSERRVHVFARADNADPVSSDRLIFIKEEGLTWRRSQQLAFFGESQVYEAGSTR